MRYEVWTRKQEGKGPNLLGSGNLVMLPALSHENEREMIQKSWKVCHVFEADDHEHAEKILEAWFTLKVEQPRGPPPPAKHPIEARMADEKFGPPRKTPGMLPFDDDLKKALEKPRLWKKYSSPGDTRYMTALEDENLGLTQKVKSLEAAVRKACVAMSLRYGYDGDLLDAYEAIQKEHGGAMAEAYHALREALAVRIPELSETDTPQRPKE